VSGVVAIVGGVVDHLIRISTHARRTLDGMACQHRREQAAGVSSRLQQLTERAAAREVVVRAAADGTLTIPESGVWQITGGPEAVAVMVSPAEREWIEDLQARSYQLALARMHVRR
jgi:hypothetical protein